uniref:Uncharacterized protein n=1 Tax=Avena sativa TaxID=4498 RepID=A0ACD5ZX52_AVESA
MRQSQLSSMINFLGKFMACIADNYTCCKSAGRRQCILKVNPPNCSRENNQLVEQRQHCHAGANTYRTPIAEKTLSHRSGHSEGDESTSAQSTVNRKRQLSGTGGANSGSHVQKRFHIDQPKFDICLATAVTPSSAAVGIRPATAMAARIIRFVDDVASSIVTMQAEFRPSSEYVRFGQTTEAMVFRRGILSTALARSSWAVGSCPPGPSSTATRAIQDWIRHAAEKNLQKIWIIHPNPRLVLVDGLSIRDQLVFNKQLSHELCVVAMRRYAQIDKFNIRDSAGMRWRKFMDLDFATVHDELRPDENDYKIESRRMWYVLVVLVDGWVVYLFDMLRRRIQVLDPAVGPFGFSTERVKMHEYVSNKLHGALFHCLEKFYSNWICTKEEWTRSFPIIMAEKFTCEESGLVATFFVRHYDGERLLIPLSQETLQNHKQNTLYEIMRIEGNHSSLPSDALEAIKNSFCVL